MFLFREFCVTTSLQHTSSFCFRRGMSDFFPELVGSMILQFHYQSFLVWLTASSCEHWQLIKRSDYGRDNQFQFYLFLRLVFNILWLNCRLCSEPFMFHSFDRHQSELFDVESFYIGLNQLLCLNCYLGPILFKFINQRFFNFWW